MRYPDDHSSDAGGSGTGVFTDFQESEMIWESIYQPV